MGFSSPSEDLDLFFSFLFESFDDFFLDLRDFEDFEFDFELEEELEDEPDFDDEGEGEERELEDLGDRDTDEELEPADERDFDFLRESVPHSTGSTSTLFSSYSIEKIEVTWP